MVELKLSDRGTTSAAKVTKLWAFSELCLDFLLLPCGAAALCLAIQTLDDELPKDLAQLLDYPAQPVEVARRSRAAAPISSVTLLAGDRATDVATPAPSGAVPPRATGCATCGARPAAA